MLGKKIFPIKRHGEVDEEKRYHLKKTIGELGIQNVRPTYTCVDGKTLTFEYQKHINEWLLAGGDFREICIEELLCLSVRFNTTP